MSGWCTERSGEIMSSQRRFCDVRGEALAPAVPHQGQRITALIPDRETCVRAVPDGATARRGARA